MKQIINYVVSVILIILISSLILYLVLYRDNKLEDIYSSLVYIESSDEETIKYGSGFVYEVDNGKNYIVTNYHVIDNLGSIYVYNVERDKVKANVLNFDKSADIAILTIEDTLNLEEINLGNSDKVKLGDNVYVIGTPLDIKYIATMTKGIISFVNRNITISTTYGDIKFQTLQVDAKTYSGNSGGPLVNNDGEVIGMMFSKEETIDGISFALPINYVMDVVSKLDKVK